MSLIRDNSSGQSSSNATGWSQYTDTQYTVGSPLTIVADTDTLLPNNKGSLIESQIPPDITTFYDGSVITGRNGDDIIISLDFFITPTSVGTTELEVWLDITGGTGTPANLANLYRRSISFPKGSGVERKVSFSHSGYTLGTWEANGAVVKMRTNGSATVHGAEYIIKRTHKAR